MRRLWKIIKENFPVALAMATTFLSIVYAGMRLMIYVYWMGYFKELNIDANILEINYEGNLFQVIFYGGIILLIVYICTQYGNIIFSANACWKYGGYDF